MQDVLVSRWPIPGPDSRSSSVPLPTELVLEITELLREQDIRRVAQVSKRFRLINGPLIYRNQHASNIGELMKLKAVAEQHDAAAMIKSLTLDTMTMNYWWHAILPNCSSDSTEERDAWPSHRADRWIKRDKPGVGSPVMGFNRQGSGRAHLDAGTVTKYTGEALTMDS
ncbi:hypothetical protein FRC02_010222 [Tulasnella sp. 418]|nr:hypothetical protein FRC02_010222 [Tulasnella sp. 418]